MNKKETILERIDNWLWGAFLIGSIYKFVFQVRYVLINLPKETKWFFQRIFRGYSDCDLWSLEYFICKKILKPLKAFRKMKKIGHPCDLKSNKEWNKVLDKIIFAIEEGSKDHCFYPDEIFNIKNDKKRKKKFQEYNDKISEGTKLFGEYLFNLWD